MHFPNSDKFATFSPLSAAFSHPTSELSITSLARYLVTIAAETSKNTGVVSNSQNSPICKEPIFFSTIKFIHELALQPTLVKESTENHIISKLGKLKSFFAEHQVGPSSSSISFSLAKSEMV